MATETNAFDWAATNWYQGNAAGWQWGNDLGHALVLFDLLGQHLAHPRVAGVHVWNTRWFDSPSRLEDVLDDRNALLPTGQALALWGQHLKSHLLALQSEAGPVYASYEPSTRALTVFLINKHTAARSIDLDVTSYPAERRIVCTVFSGHEPGDEHPTLTSTPIRALPTTLPPLSITVLDFEVAP
jgi:hypothetical protein